MHLRVNGENVDITLDNEKTVGDFLKSFESEAAKNQATTTKIKLNGKTIPAEDIDSILETELTADTLIELDVVSKPTAIIPPTFSQAEASVNNWPIVLNRRIEHSPKSLNVYLTI